MYIREAAAKATDIILDHVAATFHAMICDMHLVIRREVFLGCFQIPVDEKYYISLLYR